jgi:hypothetical protein
MFKKSNLAIVVLLSVWIAGAEPARAADGPPPTRWQIAEDGGITWNIVNKETHQDFIEMSGEQVSVILKYGVNETGIFNVSHSIIWPMLRIQPNLTGSHLQVPFSDDSYPSIYVEQKRDLSLWHQTPTRAYLKGVARFEGTVGARKQIAFRRAIFPSIDKPVVIDTTVLSNVSSETLVVDVEERQRSFKTEAERGVYGAYVASSEAIGVGTRTLKPGDSTTVTVVFSARKEAESPPQLDIAAEEKARLDRVEEFLNKLQLETPDRVLNTAFAFAKIRAAESIYRTKGGLLHGPGGGNYYAAIWANDQAEYANPFFGMFGDPIATEAGINSFRLFAKYMNPEYRPIPSSIISEGEGFWNGAGDRGDMAMIAYGAARFALALGSQQTAEELWPLIEWDLEYLRRKVTPQGVVASDSDELEGRFPAGKANLCTSSLYYDALRSAEMLGGELKKPTAQLEAYAEQAKAVRTAIEQYFGANVESFDTYRYYDKADLAGHPKFAAYATRPDALRAWIAIPLTMGIFDRKAGTIDALFSPRLWTPDGVATEAGQVTYWDRSTLYALRGVLAAGATQRGIEYLTQYSNHRLLGDHVPYPIEAFPEGGKSQLSAESALYCRVFTEGLFGLRPIGLRSFTVTPQLPDGWPSMALRKIHAFGSVFDLEVTRAGQQQLTVQVIQIGKPQKSYTLDSDGMATVTLL